MTTLPIQALIVSALLLATLSVFAQTASEAKPNAPVTREVDEALVTKQIAQADQLLKECHSNLSKLGPNAALGTRTAVEEISKAINKIKELRKSDSINLYPANSLLLVMEAKLIEARSATKKALGIKTDSSDAPNMSDPTLAAAIKNLTASGNGDPIKGALTFLNGIEK